MLRRTARLGLCLAVAGCGLVGPPETGPHGLSSYDAELRRLARAGNFADAVSLAEEEADAAGDDVLATLNLAVVAHHAGRHQESNEHLQAADLEIEDRFTKSITRAAVSLLTNDRALAWLPSRSERLMIHVYGALNYLALGEPDEAAVEARRLSMLLDRAADDEDAEALDAGTRRFHRSLRYFAAAVFEQAGERNDADVAYRLAGVDPDSLAPAVVVLVQSGFVAHRVERALHLVVGGTELDRLRHGSEERRLGFARCFSQRRLDRPLNQWGAGDSGWCDGVEDVGGSAKKGKGDDVSYLMRVAWPTMESPASSAPVGVVRALASDPGSPARGTARDATDVFSGAGSGDDHRGATDGEPFDGVAEVDTSAADRWSEPVISADLSGAVVGDFNRQAPEMLVKSVVRAAVKYAVVQAIEDEARDEDDTLADVAAVVGNAVAALTERADTRSWALLPANLQIVRLPLPPGRHEVRVAAEGASDGTLDLGEVEVRPGRVTVVSARAWP